MGTAPPPRLQGEVHVASRKDTLLDDLASALLGAAMRCINERGEFHLALSGGSTPEPLYMHLVIDPRFRIFPWAQTHLWQVDERCVPPDDERSNIHLIRQTLADHVPMRKRQIHPMPAMRQQADALYERELREHLPESGRLDFVLLGMGDDAHTASLFPGSPAIEVEDRWVALNDGSGVTPPPRVTLTFPMLNRSREVVVLVTGEKKAATVRRVEQHLQQAAPDPTLLPITGVEPEHGSLTWFLDAQAAGETQTP